MSWPGRSKPALIPRSRTNVSIASRFSRPMRASRFASSRPKCAIASSCEWSIVSPTMPALRPLPP